MGIQVAHVTLLDNSEQVKAMSKTAIAKSLEKIGLAVEKYAKEKCPVDTGNLRNSIAYDVQMSENAVYIGTPVEYGKWVELKTSRTPAQPFLRPAATEHTDEYKRIVENELKRG